MTTLIPRAGECYLKSAEVIGRVEAAFAYAERARMRLVISSEPSYGFPIPD